MFFLKMISRSFSRQFKRRLLIAVTVCLSATVSVALNSKVVAPMRTGTRAPRIIGAFRR